MAQAGMDFPHIQLKGVPMSKHIASNVYSFKPGDLSAWYSAQCMHDICTDQAVKPLGSAWCYARDGALQACCMQLQHADIPVLHSQKVSRHQTRHLIS